MKPVLNAKEVDDFIGEVYPEIWVDNGRTFEIEDVRPGAARVRMLYDKRHLRPGGTISGPAMMALSDLAMWVVVLGHIGKVELSVTTNLNINFLRKPGQADMLAESRLLKLGRQLAVGDITLYSEGDDAPVAHATSTYSVPPR